MLPEVSTIVPDAIARCLEAAAPYEFESFLVGVRGEPAWDDLPPDAVFDFKRQVKVAVGTALEGEWPARRVAFSRPELVLIYDVATRTILRRLRPVCLYGRYLKLARGVSQTPARWKHPACAGAGCAECAGTGRLYPVSVADLLGGPAAAAFGATRAVLHGCGREDVDVRCLGEGRPFVLELCEPLRRSADLEALARALHGEQVRLAGGLRAVSERAIERIKTATADKRYLARCRAAAPLRADAVAALAQGLGGVVLEQRTPWRVARRRSDQVRRRRVHAFLPGDLEPCGRTFSAEVAAESGTYIKELISGDDGRTRPSVGELLGCAVECVELDVLEVCIDDPSLLGAAP